MENILYSHPLGKNLTPPGSEQPTVEHHKDKHPKLKRRSQKKHCMHPYECTRYQSPKSSMAVRKGLDVRVNSYNENYEMNCSPNTLFKPKDFVPDYDIDVFYESQEDLTQVGMASPLGSSSFFRDPMMYQRHQASQHERDISMDMEISHSEGDDISSNQEFCSEGSVNSSMKSLNQDFENIPFSSLQVTSEKITPLNNSKNDIPCKYIRDFSGSGMNTDAHNQLPRNPNSPHFESKCARPKQEICKSYKRCYELEDSRPNYDSNKNSSELAQSLNKREKITQFVMHRREDEADQLPKRASVQKTQSFRNMETSEVKKCLSGDSERQTASINLNNPVLANKTTSPLISSSRTPLHLPPPHHLSMAPASSRVSITFSLPNPAAGMLVSPLQQPPHFPQCSLSVPPQFSLDVHSSTSYIKVESHKLNTFEETKGESAPDVQNIGVQSSCTANTNYPDIETGNKNTCILQNPCMPSQHYDQYSNTSSHCFHPLEGESDQIHKDQSESYPDGHSPILHFHLYHNGDFNNTPKCLSKLLQKYTEDKPDVLCTATGSIDQRSVEEVHPISGQFPATEDSKKCNKEEQQFRTIKSPVKQSPNKHLSKKLQKPNLNQEKSEVKNFTPKQTASATLLKSPSGQENVQDVQQELQNLFDEKENGALIKPPHDTFCDHLLMAAEKQKKHFIAEAPAQVSSETQSALNHHRNTDVEKLFETCAREVVQSCVCYTKDIEKSPQTDISAKLPITTEVFSESQYSGDNISKTSSPDVPAVLDSVHSTGCGTRSWKIKRQMNIKTVDTASTLKQNIKTNDVTLRSTKTLPKQLKAHAAAEKQNLLKKLGISKAGSRSLNEGRRDKGIYKKAESSPESGELSESSDSESFEPTELICSTPTSASPPAITQKYHTSVRRSLNTKFKRLQMDYITRDASSPNNISPCNMFLSTTVPLMKERKLHTSRRWQKPGASSYYKLKKSRNLRSLPDYDVNVSTQAKVFDTHCHLDFLFRRIGHKESFAKYRMTNSDTFPLNFEGCISVFCDPYTFHKTYYYESLLEEENIWGAFGCHPHMIHNYDSFAEEELKRALIHPKVKALGEIGLDYSEKNKNTPCLQKTLFVRQLKVAQEYNLPLVIHCRDADQDCMDILKMYVPRDYKIHRHCYTGCWKVARRWLETFPNLYIGLTPLVTFPSATEVHEVARFMPLQRLLLETDAPYFLPRKVPKDKHWSHPGMVIHTAAQIAALRLDASLEEVLQITRKNTTAVYDI